MREVFLSGRIDLAEVQGTDTEISVMVFLNLFKEKEKHPDYTIVQVTNEGLRKIGAAWKHYRKVMDDE